MMGRRAGTISRPFSPVVATVVLANSGMKRLTGSESVSLPSSSRMRAATLVMAFDCDAMRKIVPAVIGLGGATYGIVSTVLGAVLLSLALSLWRADDEEKRIDIAKRLFGFSILYLFGLFAVLLVERLVAGFMS